MGIGNSWPVHGPDLILKVKIVNGSMTLDTGSRVANIGDYDWPQGDPCPLLGTIWKNGTHVGDLTIAYSTGNLSMSALSVSSGDIIELRVLFQGSTSLPWYTKTTARRSALFDVSGSNQTLNFDGSSHRMPVPEWTLAFGWNDNSKLQFGWTVSGDDGASQDMSVDTRLIDVTNVRASQSTIDLDSSGVQTHISLFTESQMTDGCHLQMRLASAATRPRQVDEMTIVFTDSTEINPYPQSGTQLTQSRPTATHAPKLDES